MKFPDRCKHSVKWTYGKKSKDGSVKDFVYSVTYDQLNDEAKECIDVDAKRKGFQCKEMKYICKCKLESQCEQLCCGDAKHFNFYDCIDYLEENITSLKFELKRAQEEIIRLNQYMRDHIKP